MSKAIQLQRNSLPVAVGNLESYVHMAHEFPVLSHQEEYQLARDLRDHNDLEAARKLVLHNLRFVIKIARGYNGYGLPLGDLIQEGNIGLMKAIKRFDPEKNVRLVSFAVHWIRAEIHEYILRNWRIVKVATTKAQRKLFFNLRSAKKRLAWLNQEEIRAVAEDLGVKPEEVTEMESRLTGSDLGFDLQNSDEDDNHTSPVAYLSADDNDPAATLEASDWSAHNHRNLARAMETLDDRSRDILERRWLADKKETLHALANKYGVSAERIRQLENNAMKKLRESIAA
ncbi:MAG TPA: RNA polymerase sigma factor RpoH [Gammaproteobacteria bacterium]|nr:RNA polymerase sigma factor RpoH [Gammaproteobacteria bacterium]